MTATEDLAPEGSDGDGDAPYVDDADDFLPPRRKRMGPLTVALLLMLVAALGVYGGVRLQKARGTTSTAAAAATAAARGAGFRAFGAQGGTGGTAPAGGNSQGGAAGAGAGATIGTIKLVDGDTIYVTTQDGSIVKVKTTAASTTITRSVTGTAADLQPGQTVVVQGAAGSDGTVAATRVTEGGVGGGARAAGGAGG